ncbi:MAG: hypothetical protein HC897_02825, partial [Thermoanaerobaculia bacterium]|nr:hypothetical protein [Thermoanaerobaculia bacterium]
TLAELAELAEHYRGDHNPFGLGPWSLASGTALLSRVPLVDARSHRFDASWRDTKGFVVAKVAVPEWGGYEIDVVSVHLDFLVPSMRRRQIRTMIDALADRERPRVVLGDLNCCWHHEPQSLGLLLKTLELEAHELERRAPTFPTYRPRRRLDWILISRELSFDGYHTMPASLSDHLGVVADLRQR